MKQQVAARERSLSQPEIVVPTMSNTPIMAAVPRRAPRDSKVMAGRDQMRSDEAVGLAPQMKSFPPVPRMPASGGRGSGLPAAGARRPRRRRSHTGSFAIAREAEVCGSVAHESETRMKTPAAQAATSSATLRQPEIQAAAPQRQKQQLPVAFAAVRKPRTSRAGDRTSDWR